nr:DHA2 family efflux MFS transporter permease subunit [Pelosinus baikalensis]
MIGGFMSLLDTNIVNIAIPKMMTVFSVDIKGAQWILTAYMLTIGVLQPVSGNLCDLFGTRRIYLISLAAFTIGSALCGIAWSNDSMIVFRIIQATGGGLILPVTMTIVFETFSEKERNMALGLWGISAMVAPAIGPTLSGYLVEYWDWRLIFTINIPIGIAGFILAMLILREPALYRKSRFDYGGFLTSTLGLFCLLLALSKGVENGWTSTYIITLLCISFASLSSFVVIESSHENPIFDLALFKSWNFTCSTIIVFIGVIGMIGGVFIIPLFLQRVYNFTAMQTGILMLPSAIITSVTMSIAAKLADNFGAKPVVLAGITILGISSLPLVSLDMDISYEIIMLVMIMRGLGMGLFFIPATVLGVNTVPLQKVSRASSLNNSVCQISSSIGIAILTTILHNRQIYYLANTAGSNDEASFMTMSIVTVKSICGKVGCLSDGVKQMLVYMNNLYAQFDFGSGIAQAKSLGLVSMLAEKKPIIFAFDDAFVILSLICLSGVIPALLTRSAKSKEDRIVGKDIDKSITQEINNSDLLQ